MIPWIGQRVGRNDRGSGDGGEIQLNSVRCRRSRRINWRFDHHGVVLINKIGSGSSFNIMSGARQG